MKTELHIRPHLVRPGGVAIELWWANEFIGTVVGIEGESGVRIISKYPHAVTSGQMITEVKLQVPVKVPS